MQLAEFDHIEGIASSSQNPGFFGHGDVIRFLKQMREGGRLHHALLFEGPQGTGKATLAFHLAWNILAGEGKGFTLPEVSSTVWRKIGQGAHPGLLHIARGFDIKTRKFHSSITVEDIRRIARFVQQTASDNGWRIVIIDPADDMNHNAANALLKMLEDSPIRILFVLVSHNPGRLLPTIRSRCQPVAFKPLGDVEMRQALFYVAEVGGFDVDGQQAAELIKRAEGSVRQAFLILKAGGLDIVRDVDGILDSAVFPVHGAHRLASALSEHDATVQFDFFLDYLMNLLATGARAKADAGQAAQAEQIARFWQKIQQDSVEALAYNLDRKQFVIVVLQKVHAFQRKIFP